MDHAPAVATRSPQPPGSSRSHSNQRGRDGVSHGHSHSQSISHHKSKPSTTFPPYSRSSSNKENAHGSTTTTPRRRQKVRFTDMEPEPTPLLFNARDSMYMRAELQRELDFGIPAQEEAHRYARWCAEEARHEAAKAESSEASGNSYAKADMVIHPKRLSTDLSAMNIDFSNLGEDVSGLDVFSRVEAALGKKQEEKRKAKAQKEKEKKEKKESTREKLKASLLASPKTENSYSSLDEPTVVTGDHLKEKKGSRFLRKVISDRVMKPKDGSSPGSNNPTSTTLTGDARSKEVTDFFSKMAAQPAPGPGQQQPMGQPLPPRKPPTMERSVSDIPPIKRKEVSSHNAPEGRRPSHPEIRPLPQPHANGRPLSKSEPPPPPQPPRPASSPRKIPAPQPPPQPNGKLSPAQFPTIRVVPGTTTSPSARPISQHRNEQKNKTTNNDSTATLKPKPRELQNGNSPPPLPFRNEDKHKSHPSLSTNQTYLQNGTPSSSRDRLPSPSRSKSLHHPSPQPPPPPQSQRSPQQRPYSSHPPPPSQPVPAQTEDFFSRIEKDIARTHPPPPPKEKGGDERTMDKGRKLFGRAMEHIKHGGEKVREKMEKERK